MKKKELKRPFWGRRDVFDILFLYDKTLGTGYDIHLLWAMIADHVTSLTTLLLDFWAAESSLEGCTFCKKIANFEELFIGTVKMT